MLNKLIFSAVATVSCCCYLSSAQGAPLHSSLFNHKYEGTDDDAGTPGVQINEYTATPGDATTSSDGNILTYQSSTTNGLGYWETFWTTLGTNPVNNATGWTVELRVKIGTDAAEASNASFQISMKDLDGNATQGRRAILQIRQTGAVLLGASSPNIDTTGVNTDSFHIFRIAQQASSSNVTIWRDDIPIYGFPTPLASATSNNSSSARIFFGDGSGTIGGPTIYIDYVRWDSTGFYEPAPVPGDFDNDGDVDGADFVAWQTHFPTETGATLADGDANSDGDVDGADFSVWQTNFAFMPTPGVAPVPEPGSMTLAILSAAAICYVARRRQ